MIVPGLLLSAMGILLIYFCRIELKLSWLSRRWPSAAGRIGGSIVYEGVCQGSTSEGTQAPTGRRYKELDYVVFYSVFGEDYKTSRLDFSPMGWHSSTHYVGDKVTVFYCPSNPSIAILQPGLHPILLIGPVFVFLGTGLLIYGLFMGCC